MFEPLHDNYCLCSINSAMDLTLSFKRQTKKIQIQLFCATEPIGNSSVIIHS